MRTKLGVFCLLLWLAGSAAAQEVSLPDPILLGRDASVSIMVVRAGPEDSGFQQLFNTALAGARGQGGGQSMASAVGGILSQKSQQALLKAALPLQWVRVDQAGEGRILSTSAVTVSGWRGFQGLVYDSLSASPEGKKFEVRRHRGQDIVLRPGWQKSAAPRVLTRVKGTFINCNTPDMARGAIDRLLDPAPAPPRGPLWDAYARLKGNQDAWGAVLNRDGSLEHLLRWAGAGEYRRVRDTLGAERLKQVLASVTLVTWQADVVSDDRIDLELFVQAAGPEQVPEVSRVWEEVRQILERRGRLGAYSLTRLESGVQVRLSLIGFREGVRGALGAMKL